MNVSWNVGDEDKPYQHYFTHLSSNVLESIDPVQCAADFYILFGISNRHIVEFPIIKLVPPEDIVKSAITLGVSLEELRERNVRYFQEYNNLPSVKLTEYTDEALVMLEEFIYFNEQCFMEYAIAAVGGELRHHSKVTCLGDKTTSNSRYHAWAKWGHAFRNDGPEIIKDAISIFLDFPPGSFGGEPWANAAKLVYSRLNNELAENQFDNSCVFLDRIFNMQHNTGSFLNKLEWKCFREPPFDEGVNRMGDHVLKAHGLNPPDLDTLYDRASSEVKDLLNKVISFSRNEEIKVNAIYKER